MRKYIYILVSCFLLFLSCEKDPSAPSSNSNEYSIIGKIVDQASGQGLATTLVKIVSNQNAYQTTTGAEGSFSFQNIASGEYLLTTEKSQNEKVLIDTCGNYNTDTPDWGTIYSQTFASITGMIKLECENDYSFINVQLLGTDKSALTTNQGNFRIDFVFPDTYDLYISKDENYKEIRINNLVINQGEVFEIDTTMKYRFKPLALEEVPELNFLDNKKSGFCYADGCFWYTNWHGLYQYDPINQIEEQVYYHYYLGDPYITYDYNDGIWLTMDEPDLHYYRKYSIINSNIIDSVNFNSFPLHNIYNIAYDLINDCLVMFDYTSFYPKIHKYYLKNQNTETVDLQLDEYNFNNYKSIKIRQIFIDPDGKVYFILLIEDLNDKTEIHLYICNNLNDLSLIQIYKFPSTYNYAYRLSYYDNNIYTYSGKLYRLIF